MANAQPEHHDLLLGGAHLLTADPRQMDLAGHAVRPGLVNPPGLGQSQAEVQRVQPRTGKTSTAVLDEVDLLNPRLLAGDCICLSDADMVELMRWARVTARLQEGRVDDAWQPHPVLHMATLGGAQARGLADQSGSLALGKPADLVVFDARRWHWVPRVDPLGKLVGCDHRPDLGPGAADDRPAGRVGTAREDRPVAGAGHHLAQAVRAGARRHATGHCRQAERPDEQGPGAGRPAREIPGPGRRARPGQPGRAAGRPADRDPPPCQAGERHRHQGRTTGCHYPRRGPPCDCC